MKAYAQMSHKQTVQRMAAWLRHSRNYSVVVAELHTMNEETPDVIGFQGPGKSLLIECKVSRGDFLADKTKRFRALEDAGMGDLRYYAAPAGMLRPEEMPPGWGLLEIDGRCVRERLSAEPKNACKRSEVKVLMSALRRVEISTAVFIRHESDDPTAPASLTALAPLTAAPGA